MSAARLTDPVRLANPSSLFPPLIAPRTEARRFVARDRRIPCDATPFLLLDDGDAAIEAHPVDMSDSGIYVTIDPAVGSPVHNGDRVDVCFAPAGDAVAEAATARHPAKVVRVELLVGPTEERLGVALAFES
jgi:hypothetical protein